MAMADFLYLIGSIAALLTVAALLGYAFNRWVG